MKILIIHNYYQRYGGEGTVVEAEKKLLEDYGHKVFLYKRLNTRIDRYSFLKKISLYFDMHWSKDDYSDIKNLIQKEKFDIAHIHNTFLLITPSVYYACKELNIPVVQTLHNYRLLCPNGNLYTNSYICEECLKRRDFVKSILNGCWRNSKLLTLAVVKMLKFHNKRGTFKDAIDCFIALTNFSRNKFIEAGFDEEKIAIKPNFVGPDPSNRSKIGEYVLFVGRLSEEKGAWLLITSWEKIDAIPLKIIGTGDLFKDLTKYSQMKRLNINFLDQRSHKSVIEYIKNSRFVVLPSKCYETFGRVIIESFACGVPVVASRLGAMKELVQDGKTGLLFEPGNSDDLIKKINYLSNRRELIEEMGNNARKEYEDKYTPEKNYNVLLSIYNNVLTKNVHA